MGDGTTEEVSFSRHLGEMRVRICLCENALTLRDATIFSGVAQGRCIFRPVREGEFRIVCKLCLDRCVLLCVAGETIVFGRLVRVVSGFLCGCAVAEVSRSSFAKCVVFVR